MTEWFTAHPWLTLILGIFGLLVLHDIVATICNTIYLLRKSK